MAEKSNRRQWLTDLVQAVVGLLFGWKAARAAASTPPEPVPVPLPPLRSTLMRDPLGCVTTMVYDNYGTLLCRGDLDGTVMTYTYDSRLPFDEPKPPDQPKPPE
jgi:YD repeat-containing protein